MSRKIKGLREIAGTYKNFFFDLDGVMVKYPIYTVVRRPQHSRVPRNPQLPQITKQKSLLYYQLQLENP